MKFEEFLNSDLIIQYQDRKNFTRTEFLGNTFQVTAEVPLV